MSVLAFLGRLGPLLEDVDGLGDGCGDGQTHQAGIQIHTTAVLGVDVAVKDAVPDLHIPAALESQHGVRLASVRCTESQAIDPDMTNSKVSIATLARTAALAFALANQVSSAAGKPLLPIESSEVEQFVTTGLTIATSVAAWWKNNSFTAAAIEGDKRMNSLKNQVH